MLWFSVAHQTREKDEGRLKISSYKKQYSVWRKDTAMTSHIRCMRCKAETPPHNANLVCYECCIRLKDLAEAAQSLMSVLDGAGAEWGWDNDFLYEARMQLEKCISALESN